jgi:hypothetical protein
MRFPAAPFWMALALLVPVMASAQNNPPVADAGEDQTIFLGDTTMLHGIATDPDGHAIVDWSWEVVSAPSGGVYGLLNSDTAEPTFSTDSIGDYLVTARAWDGLAWSDPDALVVTVVENQPPMAVASASPLSGPAPLTVQFDGADSSDPEDDDLFYDWIFGDGETGAEATAIHEYTSQGLYSVVLVVTDARGDDDFDTIAITVTDPTIPALSPGADPGSQHPRTPPTQAFDRRNRVLSRELVASVDLCTPTLVYQRRLAKRSHATLRCEQVMVFMSSRIWHWRFR